MIQLFWNVAAKQIAAFREIHRAFGPSHACGDLLERAAVEPVLGEARIEDFNGRVGIPLVRPGSEGLRAGFLRNGYGCYACADALRLHSTTDMPRTTAAVPKCADFVAKVESCIGPNL